MTINQNLTGTNYNAGSGTGRIQYIVVHYTGNDGDTAYNNTVYFKSTNRGASAHYFVDENSVWQCVADKDIAWHVGNNTYIHANCRNSNSIGVEMCSRRDGSGTYYFKDGTVANAVELVNMLMAKYRVPLSNVLRHYDVTGKICPAPLVSAAAWAAFKAKLTTQQEEIDMTKAEVTALIQTEAARIAKEQITAYFAAMSGTKCPAWATGYMQEAIKRGMVSGDSKTAATPDTVRPESYLKRDEAVKLILEAEKSK